MVLDEGIQVIGDFGEFEKADQVTSWVMTKDLCLEFLYGVLGTNRVLVFVF